MAESRRDGKRTCFRLAHGTANVQGRGLPALSFSAEKTPVPCVASPVPRRCAARPGIPPTPSSLYRAGRGLARVRPEHLLEGCAIRRRPSWMRRVGGAVWLRGARVRATQNALQTQSRLILPIGPDLLIAEQLLRPPRASPCCAFLSPASPTPLSMLQVRPTPP